MKKKHFFLLLLMLMLVLTGCSVKKTEEAITAIGEVNLQSGSDVAYAQELYAQLAPWQQTKVRNADILQRAEATYTLLQNTQEAVNLASDVDPVLKEADTIHQADALYNQLSIRQRTFIQTGNYLSNSATLAKKEAEIRDVEEEILAIGEVTTSSHSQIEDARSSYDRLTIEQKKYFSEQTLQLLEDAEKRCADLNYAYLKEAYEKQALENVVDAGCRFAKQHPRDSRIKEVKAILAQVLLAETEQYIDNNDLDSAMRAWDKYCTYISRLDRTESFDDIGIKLTAGLLKQAEAEIRANNLQAAWYYYEKSSDYSAEKYNAQLYSKVTTALDNTRPKSGQVLENHNVTGGHSTFSVTLGLLSIDDVMVKLVDVNNPQRFVCFYVRHGETGSIQMQDGTYELRFCQGKHWYGMEDRFGEETTFSQSDQLIEMISYTVGTTIYYTNTQYSISFSYGQSGNTGTHTIEESQF